QLPPPGRRHRAAVDGAGAHADYDHSAVSPSANGGPERESSEGVDSESAGVNVEARRCPISCRRTNVVGGRLMAFAFRLQFDFPKGIYIASEADKLEIATTPDGATVTIHSGAIG